MEINRRASQPTKYLRMPPYQRYVRTAPLHSSKVIVIVIQELFCSFVRRATRNAASNMT